MKKFILAVLFSFFLINLTTAWTQDEEESGEGDTEEVQSEETEEPTEAEAVAEEASDEEQPEAETTEEASSEEMGEQQEQDVEAFAEETMEEFPGEPMGDLLPSFLPAYYVDLMGGASVIALSEDASNATLSVNSTQFKYIGVNLGAWLPMLFGAELGIQAQPFNVPVIDIDTRDATWLYARLDGRYAFILSENFVLSPRLGAGYHQSPYVFVESATSSFMSTLTQMTVRGGADMFFQFDPQLLFSAGLSLEYPLSTSIDSPNSLATADPTTGGYKWKTMLGAHGSALYSFLPWLDAGVQATLFMHNADVTIDRTGVAIQNNRALSQLDINSGIILRGKF